MPDDTRRDAPTNDEQRQAQLREDGGARTEGEGRPPEPAADTPQLAEQGQPSPRGESQQPAQQQPPGPEGNTNLDPWEIHDAVMDSAEETRDAELDFEIEQNGQTRTGSLQCTMHMPDWGVYQAVVGALPDELMDWMADMAEEFGNERDFEEIIQDEDVDTPRIIWDEQCVKQFRRILDDCLEHTPPAGRDKLTESPMRNIIYSMNPNTALAGLAFRAIEMSSNRDGVSNFRVE